MSRHRPPDEGVFRAALTRSGLSLSCFGPEHSRLWIVSSVRSLELRPLGWRRRKTGSGIRPIGNPWFRTRPRHA